MNSENTSVGRRNQVLFSIGRIKKKSFTLNEIEEIVRSEFPSFCDSTTLNLSIPLGDILKNKIVCIENMQYFKGYKVPLINSKAMLEFVKEPGAFANIDTTHYTIAGTDIIKVADILEEHTKGVYLSDYNDGKGHFLWEKVY